jgi:large subunit ribosomal protein L3
LTPGRVFKGQRMAGQMGNRKVTVQNLRVYDVDVERNLLLLRGSVPGAPDGYLVLRRAAKQPPRPFVAKQPAAPEPPPSAPEDSDGAAAQAEEA